MPTRRAILTGALLCAVSSLRAQTGRLRISIKDHRGIPIEGALAVLVDSTDIPRLNAASDKNGEALLIGLPLDICRILVSAAGFRQRRFIVTLLGRDEFRLEAELETGTNAGADPVTSDSIPMPNGHVRVHVTDNAGRIISGVYAAVFFSDEQPWRKIEGDEKGEIVLQALPMIPCEVFVSAPGFQDRRFGLILPKDDGVQIETMLEIGGVL